MRRGAIAKDRSISPKGVSVDHRHSTESNEDSTPDSDCDPNVLAPELGPSSNRYSGGPTCCPPANGCPNCNAARHCEGVLALIADRGSHEEQYGGAAEDSDEANHRGHSVREGPQDQPGKGPPNQRWPQSYEGAKCAKTGPIPAGTFDEG